MEQRETPGARPTSYWLIAKRGVVWTEVLTMRVGGEKALAVFSFEEEAGLFLLFEDAGPGWWVRKTTTEEVVHVLFGSRAAARRVVLDPLPAVLGDETNLLASLGRERVRAGLGRRARGRRDPRCEEGAAGPDRKPKFGQLVHLLGVTVLERDFCTIRLTMYMRCAARSGFS